MPARPRPAHARLAVLQLEDRLTPAADLGYAPDRVLVSGAVNVADLVATGAAVRADMVSPGLARVTLPAGTDVPAAVARMAALPGVRSAQPDYTIIPALTPSDPRFSSQWAYTPVQAAAAWGVTTGTGATIIAVVDTGVDVGHPDLAPNLWRNPGEVPGNGVDDDRDGFVDDINGANFLTNSGTLTDDVGHGTHVAGIAAARGDNGQGGAGVDWHARIMALKFMGPNGGYTSDAVRAIDYAVAHGARVINNSWGGGHDPATADAIGRARAAGVIVVNAAGNDGSDIDRTPFYPAAYSVAFDNVLTVAATNSADRLTSYTNTGLRGVTLGAPGDSIFSTLPGGRYGFMSGTSMAAPFVSGAVALLWDRHPDWNYRQIIDKITASVDTLPALAGRVATGGRLNLAKLLDAPAAVPPSPAPPPTVPPPVAGPTGGPRVVQAAFGGVRAGHFDRVTVTFTEAVDPATVAAAVGATGPAGALRVSAVVPAAGSGNTRFTLLFSRPQSAAGVYQVTVGPGVRDRSGVALDQNGNGTPGEATDRFVLSASLGVAQARAAGVAAFAATALSGEVPAGRTTRVEIAVATDVPAAGLAVELGLTHGRPADLLVRLTSPAGGQVILTDRCAIQCLGMVSTVFTDAITKGRTRPRQPLISLSRGSARGTWILEIFDLGAGEAGTLTAAALHFGASPAAG